MPDESPKPPETPAFDSEFEAVKSRDPTAHAVPLHAGILQQFICFSVRLCVVVVTILCVELSMWLKRINGKIAIWNLVLKFFACILRA